LRRASCSYIKGKLQYELDNKLKDNGVWDYSLSVPKTQDTTKDPQIIEIKYNTLFDTNYIQNKIMIEIGSRSLIEPSENVQMRSLIADAFPNAAFSDDYFSVPTVIPQRTFLEKAFLLHEEFQKQTERIRVDRMTRHIYDLEKLMDTNFAKEAMNNKDLYNKILMFRTSF